MNLEYLPEDVQFRQIRGIYLESAGGMIRQLEESIWRCGGQGLELHLSEIQRVCHTLKGSSLQLGFDAIGKVAYWIELRSARCLGSGRFSSDDREIIREGVAALTEMLRRVERNENLPEAGTLCPRLQAEAA